MTPQEMQTAAGVLSTKILETISSHEFKDDATLVQLQITYIAMLQLISTFADTMGFENEDVVKDMTSMMNYVHQADALVEAMGDLDKLPRA